MTAFDAFCDRMAALPAEKKLSMIDDLTKQIIPALSTIVEDGQSALSIYTDFVLCAVAADGELAHEEYEIIKPLFDAAAEKDVSYDEAVAIFKNSGLDNPEQYKKNVDLMVDLLGEVSPDLKDAIVTMCFLICAIDGEVSKDEKEWIKQLVDDNFGMSPMEQVDEFLEEAKIFTLATTDGDQPKMRVLGFKTVLNGKIFFAIGTFKEVYQQLVANPKCEILATVGTDFVRWDGKAVFYESPALEDAFAKALPQIAAVYKQNGLELAFFTLEEGHAEIVSVSNEKKKLF